MSELRGTYLHNIDMHMYMCMCMCIYIYALVSFLIQLMNLKTKVLKLMRTESCGSWSP